MQVSDSSLCGFTVVSLILVAACSPQAPAIAASTNVRATSSMESQVLHGRHLVVSHACGDCHGGGDNPAAKGWLAGKMNPTQEYQVGPFKTYARNLTPDNVTGLGRFTERQIFNALRYGLRPGETPDLDITSMTPGKGNFPSNPKYLAPPMPWPVWRHMPDDELWAIAAYLKHGVRPVSNRVADSEGPPDFWAGFYAENIGPYEVFAFPTANEIRR